MRRRAVILAAGDYPARGSLGRQLLDDATKVVCCDSAADTYRRRTGREPFAVVGDCDSVKGRFANMVRISEQDTNDLAKAVLFCQRNGIANPVVLGATGRRDDHSLGNVFRALDFGLEVVTDYGRFVPVEGRRSLSVGKGAAVSVFSPDPSARVTSRGLEWPLDGVRFDNLYCATLNRAAASRIELFATRRIYVYVTI